MQLEDFYKLILSELGVIAAEESPEPEDRLKAKNRYERVHAEYSRRNLLNWFTDDEVPDWAAEAMATIVASRMTKGFSIPLARRREIKADAIRADTVIVGDGQHRSPDQEPVIYY